jgi:hypothetical protein
MKTTPRTVGWTRIHTSLGCIACRYCDREVLFRGPCCTYVGSVTVNEADGCCEQRKPMDIEPEHEGPGFTAGYHEGSAADPRD